MFSLAGKVAVVTGGGSGIGLGMAKGLIAHGASVVLVGRRADVLQAAVEDIRAEAAVPSMPTREQSFGAGAGPTMPTHTAAASPRAEWVSADVADIEGIAETARACDEKFGRVDVLINCAGVNLRQPPDEVTPADWDFTVRLNLTAPFFLAREFVPQWRKRRWGKIINIASLQTQRAFPNGAAYGATKGGIAQLTRAMSEAWAKDGVTANAIAPGFVETDLTAAVFADKALAKRHAEQTCVGRNSKVEDLQGAAVFFSSPASDYVTGQTLFVDGGYTSK
jgi:gluconate 5-dehydrogenase